MDQTTEKPDLNLPLVPSASPVARYLVGHAPDGMAQMKLQRLLYLCQAASLAWTEHPMFPDKIEAWSNGPVVLSVWERHPFEGWIRNVDAEELRNEAAATIAKRILETYGDYDPARLSAYAMDQPPCREALEHAANGGAGDATIGIDAMRRHYRSAWPRPDRPSAVAATA
jgi:uncharacterized phage-associated protein